MDDSLPEEVLLDANKEAKAYEFYTVGEIEVPPQSAPLGPSSLLACLCAAECPAGGRASRFAPFGRPC